QHQTFPIRSGQGQAGEERRCSATYRGDLTGVERLELPTAAGRMRTVELEPSDSYSAAVGGEGDATDPIRGSYPRPEEAHTEEVGRKARPGLTESPGPQQKEVTHV